MGHPTIIQGGMGVGVSGWPLARAVSALGHLGVVSGIALALILVRRLQLGDPGGHMRRALGSFPIPHVANRVIEKYFIPGGKPAEQPYATTPFPFVNFGNHLIELTVLSNFTEVFLAKEGHSGIVGVNYLEKVQMPALASLFGAMLAGVDYVLMGAGIPRSIPGILDALAAGEDVQLRLDVLDAQPGEQFNSAFSPAAFFGGAAPKLKRPTFLAIVSSATLAMTLARKSNGRVDGFVVEGADAGGHNAPPRGPLHLDSRGEPVYTDRDIPDVAKIRSLGLPFWMAGCFADPARLIEARAMGATGIQVGTAFAFCEESALDQRLKQRILNQARAGAVEVFTDPTASPTGFPFKVVQLEGSLSDPVVYNGRERNCDLGYLRQLYRKSDGSVGYRCPAEPLAQFLQKGGRIEDASGRKCLCNALLASVGLGKQISDETEKPLLTAGLDIRRLARFLPAEGTNYRAADVIKYILG